MGGVCVAEYARAFLKDSFTVDAMKEPETVVAVCACTHLTGHCPRWDVFCQVWDDARLEVAMLSWGKQAEEVRETSVEVEAVFLDDAGMEEMWWDEGMMAASGVATICAWCLAEQGIVPDPADSHGICASHSALVLQTYRARKTR